ncbi:MAG TPA: hypothetical protein VGD94_24080 [Vicinamibacterales bacterium]
MNTRMLVRRVVVGAVLAVAFVVGISVASTLAAGELVPDCNCKVHNWPNPGDEKPGLRNEEDGQCYLDPCGTDIENE